MVAALDETGVKWPGMIQEKDIIVTESDTVNLRPRTSKVCNVELML